MRIDWSKPGLPISGGVHAALLLGTLVAFSSTPKFEDAAEAIPVEMISANEFSQITRGEKTAKEIRPEPKTRVDRVAEKEEQKPQTTAEAKRDVPAPVSRPPQPEPEKKPEPQPTPPPPPAPKAEAKPEPKPEPPKPEPKPEPKRAQEVSEDGLQKADKTPEPPKPETKPEPPKVERPREAPKPPQPDQLAKLIEDAKRDQKPAPPPKSEPSAKPFNPNDIKKLLESKEKPQQSGATGAEVNRTASLGSPTATGAKMNPSQRDQLGALIKDQLAQCWSPPAGVSGGEGLKPILKISLQQDGTLVGVPVVSNDQSSPAFRAMADSAVRAVRRCSPFKIPPQFLPFHGDWKDWTIIFDPREMLG